MSIKDVNKAKAKLIKVGDEDDGDSDAKPAKREGRGRERGGPACRKH
jgi:hypothetical protein